jgi:hypothetical protein
MKAAVISGTAFAATLLAYEFLVRRSRPLRILVGVAADRQAADTCRPVRRSTDVRVVAGVDDLRTIREAQRQAAVVVRAGLRPGGPS